MGCGRGSRNSRVVLAFATTLLSTVSLLSGCGSSEPYAMLPVSGRVKAQPGVSLPAAGLRLRFTPLVAPIDAKTHPRPGAALTEADGTFARVTTREYGDGLVVGRHRVEVFSAGSSTWDVINGGVAIIDYGSGHVRMSQNWCITILPHLENADLHDRFDLTRYITDPLNAASRATPVPAYLCPEDSNNGKLFDGAANTSTAWLRSGWARGNYSTWDHLNLSEELQSHFEASSGVKLPIVVAAPGEAGPMIVVGRGKTAASLGVDPSDEQLGEQGFVLRTVDPHLVIAGTARAGTLHGARYFLEHWLGVRWYAPGVTKTPRHENVVIERTDRLIRPGFAWRETSYAWPGDASHFLQKGRRIAGRPQ